MIWAIASFVLPSRGIATRFVGITSIVPCCRMKRFVIVVGAAASCIVSRRCTVGSVTIGGTPSVVICSGGITARSLGVISVIRFSFPSRGERFVRCAMVVPIVGRKPARRIFFCHSNKFRPQRYAIILNFPTFTR